MWRKRGHEASFMDISVASSVTPARRPRESVLQAYRQLREEMSLRDPTTSTLITFMETAEKLITNVENTEECVMDARLFQDFAGLCRSQAEAINRADGLVFQPAQFVAGLALHPAMSTTLNGEGVLQGSRAQWVDWGRVVQKQFCRAPALAYMNGALDTGPTTRSNPKPVRSGPDRVGAPTRVTMRINQPQGDEVDAMVGDVHAALIQACRRLPVRCLDFFSFVLDPTSFGRTIENIFHVAFLVKERRAIFDCSNQDQLPTLSLVSSASQANALTSDQVVMSLTRLEYEALLELYPIKTAAIVRRVIPL